MFEMKDKITELKSKILATRRGGFGSSDAKMIIDIATSGKIYKQEHLKRLAVFEGLIPSPDYKSKEMEVGNQREREVNAWYQNEYADLPSFHNEKYDDKNILWRQKVGRKI
jgi:hypothetical protein